jgi:type VI secretion system secreted protein VgrG
VSSLNTDYLVTEVVHTVAPATPEAPGAAAPRTYANELGLIPYAVAYRPPRTTARPRIHGVTHATIDAPADDGKNAPIDEHGRYKVLLPWDIGAKHGGRASRWVRMAQPASGADYGVHFPLHAGTEVLLVHVDGDPDRPVIIASVPNHQTRSPVTSENASQSEMKTRRGIRVTFDDAVNHRLRRG